MEKQLLILDLDETLIHARETAEDNRYHFRTDHYFVYKRPYLEEFLSFCKAHFSVAIWTSSGEEYAQSIISEIFGNYYPLEFVWSRSKCTPSFDHQNYRQEFIKNLRKVKAKGYPLERIIVVDDTPFKLSKNYGNLVRIPEFLGDSGDKELKYLMAYLLILKQTQNIRNVEKRAWRAQIRQNDISNV